MLLCKKQKNALWTVQEEKLPFELHQSGSWHTSYTGCGTGCSLNSKTPLLKSEWFTCSRFTLFHTWRRSAGWRLSHSVVDLDGLLHVRVPRPLIRLEEKGGWTPDVWKYFSDNFGVVCIFRHFDFKSETIIQTLFVCSRPIQGRPACWGPCDCNAIPRNSCKRQSVIFLLLFKLNFCLRSQFYCL